jgi:CubicO group peptidase (beta-lactamase class C family)
MTVGRWELGGLASKICSSAPAPGAIGRVAAEGSVHPDFAAVADVLGRLLRAHSGGAAVCVYHRGECVVDLWGGEKDEAGNEWTRDTMAPSFSTTKGVASTVLHILRDRGLLDYDDRVAEHWPEFAQAGKQEITIRQVLAHQSGLYHIRQMIDHADRMLDWEHMILAIERTPPIHEPGTRTGYHGLTYGFIVGEIARRVSGKSFPQLVQEEIVQPLALDGMYIGAPVEALDRAADLMWPVTKFLGGAVALGPHLGEALESGTALLRRVLWNVGLDLDLGSVLDALAPRGISSFDFGGPEALRAAIPAACGLFTARSLARMYAALAGGGGIDGVRLLSRETLELATERQEEAPRRAVVPFDMRWRLGYHAVYTTRGVPEEGFGHFGFGGSGAWADPSRELAVALIVNSGMGTAFGDLRTARISGAALACADRRVGRSPFWSWIEPYLPLWTERRPEARESSKRGSFA